MTITEVIQKSIEGGYPKKFLATNLMGDFLALHSETYLKSLMLDIRFWQALGRAMGWEGDKEIHYGNWDDMRTMTSESIKTWLYHWHRFIDHLAEGKSIESFFEELK